MPRAPKPKAEKKPYTRKPKASATGTPPPKGVASQSSAKNGGYNRPLLVEEVAKATNANFDRVGELVGKTGTQCKDTWRKTLLRAILSGGEWCITGPGWDKAMKQTLADEVFTTAKPDWDAVGALFPGKTPAQVKDVWRKVVAPKLKKGEPIG